MNSEDRIYNTQLEGGDLDVEIHDHETKCGAINYLDDVAYEPPVEEMFGGARKRKTVKAKTTKTVKKRKESEENKPMYRTLSDVPDADVQLFIQTFKLGYIAASPKPNAIFVIPDKTAMKKLMEDLKAKVDDPISPAGAEQIKNGDLEYKKYIMDIYDGDNNGGYVYRIPPEYPSSFDDQIRRRMSRAGVGFFVKLTEKGMQVSEAAEMTNTVDCKFVMRVGRDPHSCAYVFSGNLTFPTGKKHSAKTTSRQKLRKLINSNVNDIQFGAYKFVAGIVKKHGVDACKRFYGPDYVRSAFAMVNHFGDEEYADNSIDDEEIEEIHEQLYSAYTPIRQLRTGYTELRKSLSDRAERAGHGEYLSAIGKDYHDIYANLNEKFDQNELITDAGYGVYNMTEDVDLAFSAMDAMKGGDINPLMYSVIVDALNEYSLTGINAKQYMPMSFGLSHRKKGKKEAKKVKKTKRRRLDDTTDLEMDMDEMEGGAEPAGGFDLAALL